MKKLFRSRRALSPVVSAVLMMLVVMIGMSLLFGFFVNYAGDFQRGSGSAVLESMVVEDVHFVDSRAEIWVYNVGKVAFNISSVYVNGALVSNPPSLLEVTYKGTDITPLPNEVRDGAHGQIRVASATYQFSRGSSYTFKIVTERGSSFEVTEVYPW
jgi:FlaG/FlaF family flagellin (archaellin)